MSILHVNHIKAQVEKIYRSVIDMANCKAKSGTPDYENCFLSKALAAYSVQILCDADPHEIAKTIIDGGDDNGIDCVYLDNNENTLYFVQSKWIHDGSSEPELGDVKKFADGIRDLVNLKFDRFNDALNNHKSKIIAALQDARTRYVVVLAYTGTNGPAIHADRTINDLLDEMNDASELMKFKCLKQKELHQSIATSISKDPISLEIGIKRYGKYESPSVAYYGLVNCSAIADWWIKHGDQLFTKNLRGFLGDSDVNNEILNTLENDQSHFWYYNNGITIIANTVEKTMVGGGNTDFGTFHCENINIVNGAQTVSSIGKYSKGNPDSVKDAYVTCRVIELKTSPDGFGEIITRTNNRQNKIENRDFVTQDPEQVRIRTEAAIEGYTYSLLRGESLSKNDKVFDLVDATTALACYSKNPTIFTQLKREIGKLWEDITKSPYKILFNPSITGNCVIKSVVLQTAIDSNIDLLQKNGEISGKKLAILIHGNRMIGSLVYSKLNINNLNNPESSIVIYKEKINMELIKELLENVSKKIEEKYGNPIIPTLFKNVKKCSEIFNEIISE